MQQSYNHEQITTIAAVTLLIYEYVKFKTDENDTNLELHEMDYHYKDTILRSDDGTSTTTSNLNSTPPHLDSRTIHQGTHDNTRIRKSSNVDMLDCIPSVHYSTMTPSSLELDTQPMIEIPNDRPCCCISTCCIPKCCSATCCIPTCCIPTCCIRSCIPKCCSATCCIRSCIPKCITKKVQRKSRYHRAINHAMTTLRETSDGRVVFFLNNKRTDLQVGISVNDTQKRIIVVFRGSASLKNYRYNLSVCKKRLEGDIKVHSVFYNQLHHDGSIDFINDKLKRLVNIHPTYTVYCTGHSLGGAVATLYGWKLVKHIIPTSNVIVVSFGSPRLGNKAFQQDFESLQNLFHIRVMNRYDIITKMPSYHYHHVGLEISTIAIQTMYHYNNRDTTTQTRVCKPKYRYVLFNHSMTNYYCSIADDFTY